MKEMHIEIKGTGPRDVIVLVNGEDWSPCLRSIVLRMGVNDVPTLVMETMPTSVEVDADVAGILVADLVKEGLLAINTDDEVEWPASDDPADEE